MSLEEFANQLQSLITLMQQHMKFTLFCLAIFWGVHFLNVLLGYRLNVLGIWPRRSWGIPGIIFSVFLHGNFTHLLFNSIPLFLLINFMLVGGMHNFWFNSAFITVITGICTWLVGRNAIHVGASGLVMGYWSYLIMNAYTHHSVVTIILAILCVYYLGGAFANLIPTRKGVSWEAHVFGFIAGIMLALLR